MKPSVIVWDLETVPDLAGFAASTIFDLPSKSARLSATNSRSTSITRSEMQLTYRYRIKDKHAKRLNAQARAVNFVWNYCNETQMKAARDGRKWLSGYDLGKLVAGATKEGTRPALALGETRLHPVRQVPLTA